VEIMFECTVRRGSEPRVGEVPDEQQTGVVWLPVAGLDRHRIYPRALAEALAVDEPAAHPAYLGDVN
jgi:hypothetical protein